MTQTDSPITLTVEQRIRAMVISHDAQFEYFLRIMHNKYPELLGPYKSKTDRRTQKLNKAPVPSNK